MKLTVLNPFDRQEDFPDADQALREPNGLLAIGGCLSPERLKKAYRNGIFPWYNKGEPILWWSPDPRLILWPESIRISRSLRKTLRNNEFHVTWDKAFSDVIIACARHRPDAPGTWITPEIHAAYIEFHRRGLAHSVEVWQNEKLVGGLYGVALGQVFFGESMFYRRSNASKVAFVHLARALRDWNYRLIDCQVRTEHLIFLGAEEIPRREFLRLLNDYCNRDPAKIAWKPSPLNPA